MTNLEFIDISLPFKEFEDLNLHKKLKVCIATEDIVGPISNGGIGTTYTDLAILLANEGYSVHIAYLRGKHSDHHDIDHWINYYKNLNINFVPIEPCQSFSTDNRWLSPMYALLKYLENNSFDILHVSEWRGSAYLVLLSKLLHINFNNLLIIVKSSSPWRWNRENLGEIVLFSDYLKIEAEKKSIELADLVIGGSAYLLKWMADHGYNLDSNRTIVHQNVVLENLEQNKKKIETKSDFNELVFFGRLELRKGITLFCDAIKSLNDIKNIKKITFLGKIGSPLNLNNKNLDIENYLNDFKDTIFEKFDNKIEIQVITNYQKNEAIKYLVDNNVLVVMPSLAENSSLTLYECLIFGIPFIASDVGGNKELIANDCLDQAIFKPNVKSLLEIINFSLTNGIKSILPKKSNEFILEDWKKFHKRINNFFYKDENTNKIYSINGKNLLFKISEIKKYVFVFLIFSDEFEINNFEEIYKKFDIKILINKNLKKQIVKFQSYNLDLVEIELDEIKGNINKVSEFNSLSHDDILIIIDTEIKNISLNINNLDKLTAYFSQTISNNSLLVPSYLDCNDICFFQNSIDINSNFSSTQFLPECIMIKANNFKALQTLYINENYKEISFFKYIYFNLIFNKIDQIPTPIYLFKIHNEFQPKNFFNLNKLEKNYLKHIIYKISNSNLTSFLFEKNLDEGKLKVKFKNLKATYHETNGHLKWYKKKLSETNGHLKWYKKKLSETNRHRISFIGKIKSNLIKKIFRLFF